MSKKKNSFSFVAATIASLVSMNAYAGNVNNINIDTLKDRTVIHVDIDEDVKYSVFDISRTASLVMKFSGAKISGKFGKITDNVVKDAVVGYSGDDVRLSLKYNSEFGYNIVDTDKGIDIIFDKKEGKVNKDGNAANDRVSISDIGIKDYSSRSVIEIRGKGVENLARKAFFLNDGTSLVLDLQNADNDTGNSSVDSSSPRVRGVKISELKDRTRFVFDLVNRIDKGYKLSQGKDLLKIVVGSGDEKTGNSKSGTLNVESVKFSAEGDVEYIDIKTDSRDPHVLLKDNEDNIVISVKNASIDKDKVGRFDVTEFYGSIKQFDVLNSLKDNRVIVNVNLREKSRISTLQIRDTFRIVVEPEAMAISRGASVDSSDMFKYSGENIELNYDNASIKNVIKTIAEVSGVNFVISDSVQGNITIALKDVPWDQALDLILRSNGLGKEREGSIIRIAPMSELREEYKNRAATLKSSMEVESIATEFIHLKYKKAGDIKAMFDAIVTSSSAGGGAAGDGGGDKAGSAESQAAGSETHGMLSSRGSIMFDEEKNVIIIKDTIHYINELKRLIAEIDVAPKQVLIEARIVEATDNFSRDIGVSWGVGINNLSRGNTRAVSIGAGGGTTANAFNTITDNIVNGGGTAIPRGRLVDLPAATGLGSGGAIGLTIGSLFGKAVDLELSAAEGNGKIKIVSKPRVLVIDGKVANINQGTDIPFQTVSQNNGTNVEFKKANLGLVVTPYIKGDGEIVMHVLATKDSPSTAAVGGNPIISTKQVETDIYVKDNDTVVIGGIYTTNEEDTVNKVPLFGDIPVVGNLFKNTKKVRDRTELLIFITPKIVDND